MAVISVLAQPNFGYVMVTVNFSGDAGVIYGGAVRIDADGTTTPVRINTAGDATGQYMLLNDGMAVLYDTEAPMDENITYRAVEPSGVYAATSTVVNLASNQTLWLKDPLYPANDVQIFLTPPASLPDCNPGEGVFWRAKNSDTYANQTGVAAINNSSLPIALVRKRLDAASQLSLVTRTFAFRDQVLAIFANGTVLFLQTPAKYGVPDRYISSGDVQVAYPSRVATRQWAQIETPYQTVGRPAGGSYGVAGTRWSDLCSGPYATFADATAANVTWLGVVSGQAGPTGDLPTYRTWAQVKVQFANWNAVNTGGRTWTGLWAGL